LISPGFVTTDGAPIIDCGDSDETVLGYVHGLVSSRIFDWYARRWVEVNVNQWIISSLPVPAADDEAMVAIAAEAASLAGHGQPYEDWSARFGTTLHPAGDVAQRDRTEARLEALVAHLYGLSRDQVQHIFATFHRGWDYQPRLDAVLEHFDNIEASK
jgi:hypothetical protein